MIKPAGDIYSLIKNRAGIFTEHCSAYAFDIYNLIKCINKD